jgi:hypothetical protein
MRSASFFWSSDFTIASVWDPPTVHNLIVNPLRETFRRDSRYQALAKRIGILP